MKIPPEKLARAAFALLIGLLFVLPHGVRIWRLGAYRDYSPFSVRTASMMVWDETFMYGAEVNYSYRHHRLAYDTDAYEHRNETIPYSILPVEVEALLAAAMGGINAAQILVHFLFPALTSWMLMSLFARFRCSIWLAAFLTLAVLIFSFSLLTFCGGLFDLMRFGLGARLIDTLQASRNPHPNMSFPVFLGSLMLLASALHSSSRAKAAAAGILGGLLFYIYIFYAVSWSIGIGLLAIALAARLPKTRRRLMLALIPLTETFLSGLPFLAWLHEAKTAGGYTYRSNRLGMVYSHLPSAYDVMLSLLFMAAIALVAALWIALKRRGAAEDMRQEAGTMLLVLGCAGLGGIAGINLQLLTGFNVQAEKHYTHMAVQPVLLIMIAVTFLALTAGFRERRAAGWGAALFLLLFGAAAAIQTVSAAQTAEAHRILPSERALFDWLNGNSGADDVVSTTSLPVAAALPVFTHDYTLMANGTRTSGSDGEVLDRFLLANALVGAPPAAVKQELSPAGAEEIPPASPALAGYAPFLYEHSPFRDPDPLKPAFNPAATAFALARYSRLDLSRELRRFRVNYIYAVNGQTPAEIPGWRAKEVFHSGKGALWELVPKTPGF